MHKILIFSDVHWSTNTSIVRRRGNKYSQRLEYLINSMNWVNEIALSNKCDAMICAGDFFDKAQCNDEEITALRDIKWNSLPCYFLCGNHESSVPDLRFSSLKMLESENHFIISEPTIWRYNNDENEIMFLPYIVESDRKPINDYFQRSCGKNILISHNDIQGINYGGFESKIGFPIIDLKSSFDLVLNGHLHNSEWIAPNLLNVGSFSAHNFTNDSNRYNYGIWILDLDTLKIDFIENPYSLQFYKFNIMGSPDLSKLTTIKNNAVISVRCASSFAEQCKSIITNKLKDKVLESKLTIEHALDTNNTATIADLQVNHLEKFIEFCKANIANTAALESELAEICK